MAALSARSALGASGLRAARRGLRRVVRAGLFGAGVWAAVCNCGAQVFAGEAVAPVWASTFGKGVSDWPFAGANWGDANRSFFLDPAVDGRAMRVWIAKGSTDPATMKRELRPVAGQGMKLKPHGLTADTARLSYKLRLPADFKPGLGGKLGPGLCGGACNGGGRIPDGADGWSTRLGFDARAHGMVYAYLPGGVKWGTIVGRFALALGDWTSVVQEVKLNEVGKADGTIKVWADGKLVVDRQGLVFRSTGALRIDGIYFDTFYGGQSAKFAAPQDTAVDFAEIAVYAR